MISLKLNKESELSFELNIEGSKETPKARLILEMDNQMELAIKGKIEENSVRIAVPSLMDLKEKLSGENVRGYLEVIVDDNYFIPWDEHFSLKAPVTVHAESTEVKTQTNPEIKISVKTNKIKEKENEVITLSSNIRIPKSQVLLEAGDKFQVLSEGDEGFSSAIKVPESFKIPEVNITISKQDRIKIIA